MKFKQTPVKTILEGKPIAGDHALFYHQSDDVVLLEVDLDTKWCEILCHEKDDDNAPAICVSMTERSKGCGTQRNAESDLTCISFPDFAGWAEFTSSLSRYTLRAVLVRKSEAIMETA